MNNVKHTAGFTRRRLIAAKQADASGQLPDSFPCLSCVVQEQCKLNQALIQDRRNPKLSVLAASQTKDKDALTEDGVTRIIEELRETFDYVVCDSPAGIESGEY